MYLKHSNRDKNTESTNKPFSPTIMTWFVFRNVSYFCKGFLNKKSRTKIRNI